jgi:hypothetical protein
VRYPNISASLARGGRVGRIETDLKDLGEDT